MIAICLFCFFVSFGYILHLSFTFKVKEAQPKGALPKPSLPHSSKVTSGTAAGLLSSSASNGWALGGNQISMPPTLTLPFASGSSTSSVSSMSSGASITPPGVMGKLKFAIYASWGGRYQPSLEMPIGHMTRPCTITNELVN